MKVLGKREALGLVQDPERPPTAPAPMMEPTPSPKREASGPMRAMSVVRICPTCKRTKFPVYKGDPVRWIVCEWPWNKGWRVMPIDGCPHCAEKADPKVQAAEERKRREWERKIRDRAVRTDPKPAATPSAPVTADVCTKSTPKAERLAARLAAVRLAIQRKKGG